MCSSNGGGDSTAAANTVLAAAPIVTYLLAEIGWGCRYACDPYLCHQGSQGEMESDMWASKWVVMTRYDSCVVESLKRGIWENMQRFSFLFKKLDGGLVFFSRWADCWKLTTELSDRVYTTWIILKSMIILISIEDF
jgi:hypothetical protein